MTFWERSKFYLESGKYFVIKFIFDDVGWTGEI